MEQDIKQQEAFLKALKRVQEIKGFYNHLIIFIVINLLILAAALYFNKDMIFFFVVSVCGWGIGLFSHAMKTFDWNPLTGKDWEQRKIQEFLDQQKD